MGLEVAASCRLMPAATAIAPEFAKRLNFKIRTLSDHAHFQSGMAVHRAGGPRQTGQRSINDRTIKQKGQKVRHQQLEDLRENLNRVLLYPLTHAALSRSHFLFPEGSLQAVKKPFRASLDHGIGPTACPGANSSIEWRRQGGMHDDGMGCRRWYGLLFSVETPWRMLG
ncbi:hypothetical protein VTK56DRAFT_5460 [Thermocarpiscus australiensis]